MKPVTRGRLATIEPGFDAEDVQSTKGQNSLNGQPSAAFNVRDRGELPGGQQYLEGETANRKEARETFPYIHDDGNIELTTEDTVERQYSAYVAVPDEVLVYWEEFATDAFYINTPAYEVAELAIDLNEFVNENSVQNATTVGFAGRPDRASKGTVYGHTSVFSDETFGDELEDTLIQQLGVTLNSSRYGMVDLYLARSGYVEVYDGVDSSSAFAQLLLDEVVPHTFAAEELEDDEEDGEDEEDDFESDGEGELQCIECGSETDVEWFDGEPLCIVHRDAAEEAREVDV